MIYLGLQQDSHLTNYKQIKIKKLEKILFGLLNVRPQNMQRD